MRPLEMGSQHPDLVSVRPRSRKDAGGCGSKYGETSASSSSSAGVIWFLERGDPWVWPEDANERRHWFHASFRIGMICESGRMTTNEPEMSFSRISRCPAWKVSGITSVSSQTDYVFFTHAVQNMRGHLIAFMFLLVRREILMGFTSSSGKGVLS